MTWRLGIAKLFSSNIQDGGHGSNLETLQTTSDSGLLKAVLSDTKMAHYKAYHDQPIPGKRFLAP